MGRFSGASAVYKAKPIVPTVEEEKHVRRPLRQHRGSIIDIMGSAMHTIGGKIGSAEKTIKSSALRLVSDEDRQAVRERLKVLASGQKGLIRHSARWDAVMVACLLFTATVTPYESCFLKSKGFNFLFWLNRTIDLCFLGDMYVQCITIYVNSEGEDVTNKIEIFKHYLRGWFMIDFLSIMPVPFDIYAASVAASEGVDPPVQSAARVKMLRFARLFRIIKLARVIRATRIIARWEAESGLSYSLMAVSKNFVVVLTLIHWGACLWYFAATMSDPGVETWVSRLMQEEGKASMYHVNIYLRALFNSVSIMYGGTCADGFLPVNEWEYGFAIVLQSIGAACYAYALGGVCGYINNKDPATQQFHTTVDTINSFMQQENIHGSLRKRTREYFRHAQGVIRSRYYNQTLSMVSPTLKGELIGQMHHGWFEKVKFFKSAEQSEKKFFLTSLAMALHMEMFAQAERIIRPGELCAKMYVIHWGLCGMLGRIVGPGKVAGEDLILNLHHPHFRRHYSCMALTFVQSYVLDSKELGRIVLEEDLHHTRERLRKAALKLCFSRTIIMEAQRRVHADNEAARAEAKKKAEDSAAAAAAVAEGLGAEAGAASSDHPLHGPPSCQMEHAKDELVGDADVLDLMEKLEELDELFRPEEGGTIVPRMTPSERVEARNKLLGLMVLCCDGEHDDHHHSSSEIKPIKPVS